MYNLFYNTNDQIENAELSYLKKRDMVYSKL